MLCAATLGFLLIWGCLSKGELECFGQQQHLPGTAWHPGQALPSCTCQEAQLSSRVQESTQSLRGDVPAQCPRISAQ